MQTCVFCENGDYLDSKMEITLEDGSKVVVAICAEHAEDATIKSARAAYTERQKQIDDLIKHAKKLGLNLQLGGQTPGGLTMVSMKPQNQPQILGQSNQTVAQNQDVTTSQPEQSITLMTPSEGCRIVSTGAVDNSSGTRSITGSAENNGVSAQLGAFSSYRTSSMQDKLNPALLSGQVKMTVVEGRDGMPVEVPVKRVDGTGTTQVMVSKRENDISLQRRFRNMAADSNMDNGERGAFRREGYSTQNATCPLCRGKCTITQTNLAGMKEQIMCPKCYGAGTIPVN